MLKTRIEHAQSQVRRRRRRGLSRDWRKFGEKWRGSKAAALGANLVGAIGCILGNKHVMTHGARAPLFLTFMGYLLIVLYHQLQRTRNIGIAPVFDVEGAQLPPYRPPTKVVVALVLLTATAPSLANASLMFNSVGFTQLSKVLTTPSIAFIERARGHGHPLDAARLLSMVFIHVGVYVASVADVTLNRTGCLVALANVCVTARYKTAWSSASRDAIARFVAASFFGFGRLVSMASPRGSRRRSHRARSQAARDARGARGSADARARRARRRAGARRAHAPVGRRRAHTVYCIFRVGRAAEHGRDVRRDGLRAALLHRGPPRRPFSFPRFGLRRRRHHAGRVDGVTARLASLASPRGRAKSSTPTITPSPRRQRREDAITAIRYAGARRVDVGDGLHGHRPPERADAPGPRPVQDGLFAARVLRRPRRGPESAAARRRVAHDGVHRALHAVHARAAAAPRGAAPRRRASGAFAVRGPAPLAGAAAEGRERALVVGAADAGGAERVVVAVVEAWGGGGVVGMFSGLSLIFSGAPEGGREVGGSFVHKNGHRPGGAADRRGRRTATT